MGARFPQNCCIKWIHIFDHLDECVSKGTTATRISRCCEHFAQSSFNPSRSSFKAASINGIAMEGSISDLFSTPRFRKIWSVSAWSSVHRRRRLWCTQSPMRPTRSCGSVPATAPTYCPPFTAALTAVPVALAASWIARRIRVYRSDEFVGHRRDATANATQLVSTGWDRSVGSERRALQIPT